MLISDLPSKTIVNKVIPKNAFDSYTNTKQKKQMVDLIERIRWTNKLSLETINLGGKEISEIQIFEIYLRRKDNITELLQVIDKAIPYPIIFHLSHLGKSFFSTSKKHNHPVDENTAVIDWTFTSGWFDENGNNYSLKLERNLDYIFLDFCKQISGKYHNAKSLTALVDFESRFTELNKAIEKLKSSIGTCKQFNKKVELNTQLNKKKDQLSTLLAK